MNANARSTIRWTDVDKEWLARDPKQADIVAFLQNPWFKPGTGQRTIELYAACASYRRAVLSMSATGRALERAFGEELFKRIWWDNACQTHGTERAAAMPPDPRHIFLTIRRLRPKIVLGFGRSAERGITDLRHGMGFMSMFCCHPMARGDRAQELKLFAERVKTQIKFFDLMREA